MPRWAFAEDMEALAKRPDQDAENDAVVLPSAVGGSAMRHKLCANRSREPHTPGCKGR